DHGRNAEDGHHEPQQAEIENLGSSGERGMRDEAKWPGLEDGVRGHIGDALVGEEAQIHRSPEAIRSELVGISGMVGERVVKPMPVDPADRVHVNAECIIYKREALDEPLLVLESAMGDAHVNHGGEVKPGKEPAGYEIRRTDG